ncbi:MAG: hypothetical protein FWC50_02150 [Planctomycetaceae bacterium]|nr:hypothetical protein [Planctomycetaceae bacterium]
MSLYLSSTGVPDNWLKSTFQSREIQIKYNSPRPVASTGKVKISRISKKETSDI